MLALLSTRSRTRFFSAIVGVFATGLATNGRANANARRQMTTQRSNSSKRCSSRLRFVMRGGEGDRNISELNNTRSRELLRIKCKRKGRAMAAAPAKNNGARKLMQRGRTVQSSGIAYHRKDEPSNLLLHLE